MLSLSLSPSLCALHGWKVLPAKPQSAAQTHFSVTAETKNNSREHNPLLSQASPQSLCLFSVTPAAAIERLMTGTKRETVRTFFWAI